MSKIISRDHECKLRNFLRNFDQDNKQFRIEHMKQLLLIDYPN